jgi:hypothetical protein
LPDEVFLQSYWPRIFSTYSTAFLLYVGTAVGTDLRG